MANKLKHLIKLFVCPAQPQRNTTPIREPNYKLLILQQKVRAL